MCCHFANVFLSPLSPTELNLARARTERWNTDQSRTDRTIRELRSQVDDLTEALSAKDGQLAVLKVRLDEADQLLKVRNSALEEAQNEKSRFVSRYTIRYDEISCISVLMHTWNFTLVCINPL